MKGFGGVRILPLLAAPGLTGTSPRAPAAVDKSPASHLEAMQQQQLTKAVDDMVAVVSEAMANVANGNQTEQSAPANG